MFEAPVEPVLPPEEEGFDVAIPIQPFTVSIHLCIWFGMFHLPCFALSIQERDIEGESVASPHHPGVYQMGDV